jgi:hypothetical protein
MGNWEVSLQTGATHDGGPSPCWIQVRAFTDLNVFYGFTNDPYSDVPRQHGYMGEWCGAAAVCSHTGVSNGLMSHCAGMPADSAATLQLVTGMSLTASPPQTLFSARYSERDGCSYAYLSDTFRCVDDLALMVGGGAGGGISMSTLQFSGIDECGYRFSRLSSSVCVVLSRIN